MPALEFDFAGFRCDMEFEDMIGLSHLAAATFKALFAALQDFHEATPLATYLLLTNGTPGQYRYEFEARDGRVWNQVINFSENETDPVMTFAITDWWPVSQFKFNRAVRDQIVRLHHTVNLIRLDATFVEP